MSLQIKLMVPLLLLITLLVGATGVVAYQKSAENLEKAVVADMEGETASAVRAMGLSIKGVQDALAREARGNFLKSFFQTASPDAEKVRGATETLNMSVRANHLIERLVVTDLKGVVMATAPTGHPGETYPAQRDYFRKAVNGETVITEAYKSPELGHGVITVAQPIIFDGQTRGVIFATVSLQALYEDVIKPIRVGETGYGFAITAPGVAVMHKEQSMLFNERTNVTDDYRIMVREGNGFLKGKGLDGRESVVTYRSDPVTKMILCVRALSDEILNSLSGIRNIILGFVAGSILVGGVAVVFLLRPVLVALQRGLAFAQDIAAGRLDGELKVKNRDETGKLADALREIPLVLKRIVNAYGELETKIEAGYLLSRGDAAAFSGEFATLVKGTNSIMDRFDMVLNSIPSPVVILDRDLHASYLNSTATNIAGTDYAGKTCEALFGREDFNSERCALRRSIESLRPASGETRAHPRGKTLEISYTSIPMMDREGKLAAVLQLITDLTEIKKTQNTIIEVANQALGISDRVASASEHLSSQVEQVTRGADVQRDRVAGTATSMEEMNATVLEVAKNAGEASEQAEGTREKAQHGVELVDKVINSIKEVNQVAQELHTNMKSLGDQAESIGGVMNVISDIADQTNLLALNAAIEAARAGEAGRGFAVVADEVRKLAEKTMSATSEVGGSIKGIQSATALNIARVSEAAKGVSHATDLAATSGEALHEILSLAGRNSALIAGIATAAEQQSATSEEIAKAIEEINRIADETAVGMAESSAAVQEVTGMSQQLKSLLSKLQA